LDTIELSGRDVSLTQTIPSTELGNTLSESGTGWYQVLPARDEVYNEDVAAAYDRNPIGAGPMSFVDHVRASSMTFERFEDFYYQPENGFPIDKRMAFEQLTLYLVLHPVIFDKFKKRYNSGILLPGVRCGVCLLRNTE